MSASSVSYKIKMGDNIRETSVTESLCNSANDTSYKVEMDEEIQESGVTEKLHQSDKYQKKNDNTVCNIREKTCMTIQRSQPQDIKIKVSDAKDYYPLNRRWNRIQSWITKRKWRVCTVLMALFFILCIVCFGSIIYMGARIADLSGQQRALQHLIQLNNDRILTHQTEVVKIEKLRKEFERIYQLETDVQNLQKQHETEKGRIQQIENEVRKIENIEKELEKLNQIEKEVEKIGKLETEVKKIGRLETEVEKIVRLETEVRKISRLETEVNNIRPLGTNVDRLLKLVPEINKIRPLGLDLQNLSNRFRNLEDKIRARRQTTEKTDNTSAEPDGGQCACLSIGLMVLSLLLSIVVIR